VTSKVVEERRVYESGASRSPDKDMLRYDLIPPSALRALAERFGLGAVNHGEGNYLKGIPYSVILFHMQAHLENFRAGDTTEDDEVQNLAAVMWGCCALIEYKRRGRIDLDDRMFTDVGVIPPRVARDMSEDKLTAVHMATGAFKASA
jgi:hypothetical protein